MFRFNESEREAIFSADAELSNAGLPDYTDVVTHLVYLVKQGKLSDLAESKNAALIKAEQLLEKFRL